MCNSGPALRAGVACPQAYLLYPQIYAAKLKLHPLLVLVALYVTEHIVGVKGLFLTLPVTLFILGLVGFKPSGGADAPANAARS